MAEHQDRRVVRTQQLLREALFALIREQGFEALSVQAIIDRANVGRATFYAHFNNKEDLLTSGFEDVLAALRKRQRQSFARRGEGDEHLFAFSHDMFAHADGHRAIFQAMLGKRSGATVNEQLHRLSLECMREEVRAATAASRAVTAEALAQCLAGAFFGLLVWWLEGPPKMTVEEVNQLFRQLAVPALKAARG